MVRGFARHQAHGTRPCLCSMVGHISTLFQMMKLVCIIPSLSLLLSLSRIVAGADESTCHVSRQFQCPNCGGINVTNCQDCMGHRSLGMYVCVCFINKANT
jgi:predicted RNA-binding Zn-ribbon protein involved in translation (DUF1610 family)